MKVFISSDMEGTAGIVDWQQCVGPGAEYDMGRRLLLGEVNAAIDGAVAAGATEIVVNDSHGSMQNLPPDELRGDASYISGRHKPLYMMEGLDSSYDAALFVSYHAAAGTAGVLSHTYNPAAITQAWLGGTVAAESGLNALVARAHRVPIALITGDQHVGPEARPFCPDIEVVEVKRAIGRASAHSVHPDAARRLIRDGAKRALDRVAANAVPVPEFALPARLDVDFRTEEMADMVSSLGFSRVGARTASITDDDPLRLYRTFVAAVHLTRGLAEIR